MLPAHGHPTKPRGRTKREWQSGASKMRSILAGTEVVETVLRCRYCRETEVVDTGSYSHLLGKKADFARQHAACALKERGRV